MSYAPVGLRARAQIAPFSLDRPTDVRSAAIALARPCRVALMGGGIDLIDRLKGGEPLDRLVALAGIPELRAISLEGDTLSIGAGVTHDALIASPLVATHLPDLCRIWRQIANPRVRAAGTIGGNLMAGQRHYDAAPALLALRAEVRVATSDGTMSTKQLKDVLDAADVLLLAVRVPAAAHQRLAADRSLHPMISVYLATSSVQTMRLVVGCAHTRPVAIDLGDADASAFSQAIDALPPPLDDDLASGAYRRRMANVLGRRLLEQAARQW